MILKRAYDLSDEALCERGVENPYFTRSVHAMHLKDVLGESRWW